MKRLLLGLLVIVVLIAIVLYAMGYWRADVQEGSLPNVDVQAQGGSLPKIDVDSNIVVGTKETTVDAPGGDNVGTTVEVPTVGTTNEPVDPNANTK